MLYEIRGFSTLYDAVVRRMIPDEWRRKCAAAARGQVLEVGVGTGLNLPFYHDIVTGVTGIDISEEMLAEAANKARISRFNLKLLRMDVENMSFADASFDTVTAEFVFCTVKEPLQGLRECRRVLRPGGRLVLLEHVASRRPLILALMKLFDPLAIFFLGDHFTRDTLTTAEQAGFRIEQVERLSGDYVILAIGTVTE